MSDYAKRYVVEIGYLEPAGPYAANILSVAENKASCVESANLKLLLAEVGKKIRKREAHIRKFPLPEPRKILTLDEARGTAQIITPARN